VPEPVQVGEGESKEEYNEKTLKKWNDEVLLPCENCGRTFLPDRLEIHLKSCRAAEASQPASPRTSTKHSASNPATPSSTTRRSLRERTSSNPPARPNTVVCHICGREFGSASIEIHTAQCARKWEANEALKPKAQRRPVPEPVQVGEGESKEEYNEKTLKKWNDEVLLPCENCGRTFLPDRLEIHRRSCRSADGSLLPPTMNSRGRRSLGNCESSAHRGDKSASPAPRGPSTVVCHICGREFGSASIEIHTAQCARKWEATEALKPKARRRSVPTAPKHEEAESREQYNARATEVWTSEALLACPKCGRTFLPDRLEVHVRSCRSAEEHAPTGRSDWSQVEAPTKTTKPMCVTCHVCGRDFGTASFQIHLFQCEKKWEAQEARKPLEERRPVPTAPQVAANASLEDRNSAAATKWSEEALVACPVCGRTFLPESLVKHQKSCRPNLETEVVD